MPYICNAQKVFMPPGLKGIASLFAGALHVFGQQVFLRADNIFDYIQLTPEYAIYEIPTPKSWEGKTIRDKGVRAKYNLNILAVKKGTNLTPLPDADHVFSASERLIVMCRKSDIEKIVH